MSERPSRESTAGRTYLALRKKAREEGRPTDELLQLAALEAFLVRLATSARAADLVLKGGVLLAAYDARRPTRDVDLVARNVANTGAWGQVHGPTGPWHGQSARREPEQQEVAHECTRRLA